MIEVWGRTSSFNVQKVMWALAELDLTCTRHEAGGKFGGLDADNYGAMNPNRRIPVLKDGDAIVWESNAVVRYLAAKYGAGTLWADEPLERSLADRWMDWQAVTLQMHLHPIFWGLVRTPPEQRNQAEIDAAVKAIQPLWLVLDQHLSGQRFVAGDQLTMGDIPVGCAYWRYINIDIERPALPNCDLWFGQLKARQGYRDNVMLPVV